MSQRTLFQDLPATFPAEDRFWRLSAVSSVFVNALMIATAVVLPMMFTSTIPNLRFLTYLAPPPPPPGQVPIAAPGRPHAPVARATPSVPRRFDASLVAPVAVPAEIAQVVDVPVPSIEEAGFGVPGGIPGGTISGSFPRTLSSTLLSNANSTVDAPIPPPPEPVVPAQPQELPIRLSEFNPLKTVRTVAPVYPRAAKLARIQGTVFLDVTLNEAGKVDEVRVLSGHPLLAQAALDCVKDWIYEPPRVNGKAVRVIIPVRLNFRLEL